jgi:hypothetical protein
VVSSRKKNDPRGIFAFDEFREASASVGVLTGKIDSRAYIHFESGIRT